MVIVCYSLSMHQVHLSSRKVESTHLLLKESRNIHKFSLRNDWHNRTYWSKLGYLKKKQTSHISQPGHNLKIERASGVHLASRRASKKGTSQRRKKVNIAISIPLTMTAHNFYITLSFSLPQISCTFFSKPSHYVNSQHPTTTGSLGSCKHMACLFICMVVRQCG